MAETEAWHGFFNRCSELVKQATPLTPKGYLKRVTGMVMEAVGLKLPLGAGVRVFISEDNSVEAEVVGFADGKLFLMPTDVVQGLVPGAVVVPLQYNGEIPQLLRANTFGSVKQLNTGKRLPVGEEMLGRVVDAAGRPLDDLGPLHTTHTTSLESSAYNPLDRAPIDTSLDVGVRAINGVLTVGRGQRMGLFAGSGVGKSVLLSMMTRFSTAEITIVGLIGERGREVKEFIEMNLGKEGLARSVVVAAPADTSPLLRLQGAAYATALAEYFRDQGKHVLLIMDSLTRYAMAQREIALAIGEPPVTRGYPPSVFSKLPHLVERAGNGPEGGGSITAFYTVLAEGDDQQDPIADSARAILDGHIVLSRFLADEGHYPAIDIEQSISRVMPSLVSPEHLDLVRKLKQVMSRYQRSRDLISIGAYKRGSDPSIDEAIIYYPKIQAFLQQRITESASYEESVNQLKAIFQAQ